MKSVLEDPTYSLAEFRVALYLVTKPPGWKIHAGQIAKALGLTITMTERALTGLRKRKDVRPGTVMRDAGGTYERRPSELDRERFIAKPQLSTTPSETEHVVPPAEIQSSPSSHHTLRNSGRGPASEDTKSSQLTPHPLIQGDIATTVPVATTVKDQEKNPPPLPMRIPAGGSELAVRGREIQLSRSANDRDAAGIHARLAACCPELTADEIEYVIGALRANPKIASPTAVLMARIKDGTIRDYVGDVIVKYRREQAAIAAFRETRDTEAAEAKAKAQRQAETSLAESYVCTFGIANYSGNEQHCTELHDGCGEPAYCDAHRAWVLAHDGYESPPYRHPADSPWPNPVRVGDRRDVLIPMMVAQRNAERERAAAELAARVEQRRQRKLAPCDACGRVLMLDGYQLPEHDGNGGRRCAGSGLPVLAALRDKIGA